MKNIITRHIHKLKYIECIFYFSVGALKFWISTMLWLAIKILLLKLISIMSAWIEILYNWQTLAAGLIALIGALGTIAVIKHQTNLEKKRYLDSRNSKMFAKRAELPDALDALCLYTKECISYLHSFPQNTNIHARYRHSSATALPEQPIEAISQVKACIEFLDPQAAGQLYDLVVFYQIYNARIKPTPGRIDTIAERLFDTVKLYHMSTRLLPFARNEVDVTPDSEIIREDMINDLNITNGLISIENHQLVENRINKEFKSKLKNKISTTK